MDHLLRADFCAGSAADTFLFIYFCYPIFIDGNGSELTFIYTGSTADTAICTSCFPLRRSASPITWLSFLAAELRHVDSDALDSEAA